MRTKTPFRRKRLISRGSSSSTSVEVKVERELQCSRCKAIFPDYLARCPEWPCSRKRFLSGLDPEYHGTRETLWETGGTTLQA